MVTVNHERFAVTRIMTVTMTVTMELMVAVRRSLLGIPHGWMKAG